MLHTDDIQRMLIEVVTGKEPTLRNEEADAFRENLRREVAEIEARGGEVDVPREIPEV